jgi:FAD/FMN-containing dehydrogenase
LGWLGAWNAAPSAYAVVAESPDDIAAAVNFAREHRLRLVIKGTGHDYLGRSNAPNSLLVWTHKMRRVTLHDLFVGQGCPSTYKGIPAVTVEAGTRWLEAYQEVTVKNGRYVQGGGCTSVGVAGGFIQGGGFGSWSNKYGLAAAGMLEAHVVTADGKLRVANACQNSDLFWALRGGGGGTFGVVTQVTLMTHPAPTFLGFVLGDLKAKDDNAFRELLERFLTFYRENLRNEDWGENVKVKRNNSLQLTVSFHGMTAADAERLWQPFLASLKAAPDRFSVEVRYLATPGNKMWDYAFAREHFPFGVVTDSRPGQTGELFWWASNQGEVAAYWYAYQSRWIPKDHFEAANAKAFAQTLFEASRHWSLEVYFNKGQASASAEALRRDRDTSVNPAVYRAAALVIAAATGDGSPEVPGHEPNVTEGEAQKARVTAAMKIIREATPGAGTYVNEADYFEPDWQHAFWGENYDRLLQIKYKYDPTRLFSCHHCVGSEDSPRHP